MRRTLLESPTNTGGFRTRPLLKLPRRSAARARRPAGKESEEPVLGSGQRTNRNTGYLRHHRLLRQERPQNKLRELLLRQVHQCIGNNSVHEFDGQAVPDRRISRMSPVPGLQPRSIPLQRVRRGGRD